MPPEIIAYDYCLTTDNLREAYLQAYPEAREAVLERIRCPPERVSLMLHYIHTHYGTVEAYLASLGLTPEEIAQLRARLLLSDIPQNTTA